VEGCTQCRDWGHTENHAAHAAQHVHTWIQRQNVTTSGYALPPYEVCECGAARSVASHA
jgi:hypothetical protein